MKVIGPFYSIFNKWEVLSDQTLKDIEKIGRVCYKSEHRITDVSHKKFVSNLIKNGHDAMLEHVNMSVRFIVDRGISHEMVRHRMASFAQESTRYCNYSQEKFGEEITFIEPYFLKDRPNEKYLWEDAMRNAEKAYFDLMREGARPEEARTVLPNSLKTEIVVTANMREWRHILKLRTAPDAHPQMREIMFPLLAELQASNINILFENL